MRSANLLRLVTGVALGLLLRSHLRLLIAIEESDYQSTILHASSFTYNPRKCSSGARMPPAFIHVGPRKTGTTALQQCLDDHKAHFEEDSFQVLFEDHHSLSKCVLMNDQQRCEHQLSWGKDCLYLEQRFYNATAEACKMNHGFFFSSEALVRPNAVNLTRMQLALEGFEVHVVLVYRRLFEWLVSHFGQKYRNTWNDWQGILPSNKRTILHYMSKSRVRKLEHQNLATLVDFYHQAGFRTHLINYHEQENLVPHFFCQKFMQTPTVCKAIKDATTLTKPKRSNEAVSIAFDEIAVAAYEAGWFQGRNISRPHARLAVQSFIEKNTNQGVEDLSKRCVSDKLTANLKNLSIQLESKLFPDFFASQSGGRALEANIEAYRRGNLCTIDTLRVLQTPGLKDFLQTA